MKKNNRKLLILSILMMIQINAMALGNKTLIVKNLSKQDFWISILAMDCDSIYSIPMKHIYTSDTTFAFIKNSRNLIVTFLNSNKSLMTTLPVFFDSSQIEIQVRLDSNSVNQVAFYKDIQLLGGKQSKEFSKIVSKFLINAILGNPYDTAKVINQLKVHEKKSANIFASWLILNMLSNRESKDFIFYRKKISDCSKVEKQFYPQNIIYSKEDFNSSGDFYDSLSQDLRLSCLPASDFFHAPFFVEDTCVLIFWASWCGPCIKQIKKMSAEQLQSPKYYFISIDAEVQNGLNMARTLKIENRLLFLDSLVLNKYGYKSIPIHLKLIKKSKEVLLE